MTQQEMMDQIEALDRYINEPRVSEDFFIGPNSPTQWNVNDFNYLSTSQGIRIFSNRIKEKREGFNLLKHLTIIR